METMLSILSSYGDKEKRITKDEAEDLIAAVAPQRNALVFDWSSLLNMF